MKKSREILFGTLVVGVTGICILATAELYLYFFNPQLPAFLRPDPVLGTMHFSDYTVRQNDGCIKATTRFNKEGMNDVDHQLEKPSDVYRIAVIGDSYVEAMQFELESAYFKVLEKDLRSRGWKVEVLAFGVGGFGTLQEHHLLRDYALKYQPDLVVLSFFTYNDIRNNSFDLERSMDMPYATIDSDGTLVFQPFNLRDEYVKVFESPLRTMVFENSHLIRFIYRLSNHSVTFRNILAAIGLQTPAVTEGQTKQEVVDELYISNMKPEWEQAWRVTEALIERMRDDAGQSGADFMLFSLSNELQLSEEKFAVVREKYPDVGLDAELPEKRLASFTEAHGIPYFSALPSMKQLSASGIEVHPACHGHWSESASASAGTALADFVVERFLKTRYTSEMSGG